MAKPSGKVLIFLGDYFFLSNLYMANIMQSGEVYKSAEHCYQAARCARRSEREKILNAETSKSAKVLGRFVIERHHWDVDKIRIMEKILRLKFRDRKLKKQLQKTGDMELINQNYHHDLEWGVCGCTHHMKTGQNMLGKILMKIRANLFPSKSVFSTCNL